MPRFLDASSDDDDEFNESLKRLNETRSNSLATSAPTIESKRPSAGAVNVPTKPSEDVRMWSNGDDTDEEKTEVGEDEESSNASGRIDIATGHFGAIHTDFLGQMTRTLRRESTIATAINHGQ
jgi:hypothetical protein